MIGGNDGGEVKTWFKLKCYNDDEGEIGRQVEGLDEDGQKKLEKKF